MKPKVSIIIPVYNSAEVIGRCLDSIVSQTYGEWEAICVDDGSTDGSGGLLDTYASRDGRIRVVHKANAGVGAARNTALELVGGQFIFFVDSDDFLHPQALDICVHLACLQSADLVAFTYDRGYRTAAVVRHFLHIPERYALPRFRQFNLSRLDYRVTDNIWDHATEYSVRDKWAVKHCQPWRCMYRTSRIRDIRFTEGVMYEDFPWWSEVLLNVRLAVIINIPLYFYYPSFSGYIMSAAQKTRVDSLERCLAAADRTMESKAAPEELEIWKRKFRTPFADKLEKKKALYEKSISKI